LYCCTVHDSNEKLIQFSSKWNLILTSWCLGIIPPIIFRTLCSSVAVYWDCRPSPNFSCDYYCLWMQKISQARWQFEIQLRIEKRTGARCSRKVCLSISDELCLCISLYLYIFITNQCSHNIKAVLVYIFTQYIHLCLLCH